MSDDKQEARRRKEEASRLADGRWPAILSAAGMPDQFFRKSHGPCPFCGGKDRYRWSEKYGGVWYCSHCTVDRYADGWSMLMKHMGFRFFGDAVDHVLEHFNGASGRRERAYPAASQTADPKAQLERNINRMKAIWDAARPVTAGDPVDRYMQMRVPGMAIEHQMLRFHPALDYWAPPQEVDGKPVLLGKFPAMVAKAFNVDGEFVQIHKTYLTPEGFKAEVPVVKKMERGVGASAFFVPMMAVTGDTLGICEGLETGWAAAMFRGIPVWPCLTGGSMAGFQLPESLLDTVSRVVIFADNDERKPVAAQGGTKLRCAGSFYAEQAAQRVRAQGKRVLIVKALRVGTDMANQWESRAAVPA
ncbi:DUF7146 domain-containing protein [Ramlibacter albus]|uniref:Toprim domain-containing protein n=1 Tax=Ramlibacter albus TaxID=2079448 RepID=A0A923MBI5_9BURK|nr:primase-helicase zinc-binding domain-containing protein [Ramlibacter albus]MBC5767610.1 toprim domain-containing protein [Ramlibacter albus]